MGAVVAFSFAVLARPAVSALTPVRVEQVDASWIIFALIVYDDGC